MKWRRLTTGFYLNDRGTVKHINGRWWAYDWRDREVGSARTLGAAKRMVRW